MGLLKVLFGKGGNISGIEGILDNAGGLATSLRNAFTGEMKPEDKAKLEAQVIELEHQVLKAQSIVNKAETQSISVFVAGWRPFLGWIFVTIVGLHYLIFPVLEWILAIVKPEVLPLPTPLDLNAIWPALIGMLGLGTMRTFEKAKGVHSKH